MNKKDKENYMLFIDNCYRSNLINDDLSQVINESDEAMDTVEKKLKFKLFVKLESLVNALKKETADKYFDYGIQAYKAINE